MSDAATIIATIISTGLALAGLVLYLFRWLRQDNQVLRQEIRQDNRLCPSGGAVRAPRSSRNGGPPEFPHRRPQFPHRLAYLSVHPTGQRRLVNSAGRA